MLKKISEYLFTDNDRIDSVVAFFTGDLATIYVSYHLCWVHLNFSDDLLIPILLAILTGFFGGAFAILGKIFVKWIFKSK